MLGRITHCINSNSLITLGRNICVGGVIVTMAQGRNCCSFGHKSNSKNHCDAGMKRTGRVSGEGGLWGGGGGREENFQTPDEI